MKLLSSFSISISVLLGLPLLVACSEKELSERERFDLLIQTLQGDSTGYKVIYTMAENVDTLYGVFNVSLEYVPLKIQLDQYDSLAIHFLTKRDSTFNRRYIPSKDEANSTYLNWNRFNDSVQLYLSKGNNIRSEIDLKAGTYGKTIKGYVVDFKTELVGKQDTILVHKFDIWLKSSFPISSLKHEKVVAK